MSSIVVDDRKILLVKRGNRPYRGKWCLPSGFAETDESIEEAALRELEEETGIRGNIINLVDVDSCTNYFYGDLIFITFEVVPAAGILSPGSDTVNAKYYPIHRVPNLAFESNTKAIRAYVESKSDYWAIVDSFTAAVDERSAGGRRKNLLSDRLLEVIDEHETTIIQDWQNDIVTNHSTPSYRTCNNGQLFERAHRVLACFSEWARKVCSDEDVRTYFIDLGRVRKIEGFALQEVLSALSLTRKHIWEFALSHGITQKPLDIYMAFEFDRRMMIFFDRATFYTTLGYME